MDEAERSAGRGDVVEAASTRTQHRFPGFVMPFGWYAVGHSDEFAVDTVSARRLCETELIVWRDSAGAAVVQEAFCPHLGAHIAVGGRVEGDCVRCPFHGWTFGTDGRNVEIHYDEQPNRSARLRTYPTVEVVGQVFFWWHPDPEVEPAWALPEIGALADGGYAVRQAWTVEAPWQEFSENGSDTAHFAEVHGSPRVATMEASDYSGPVRHMLVANDYPTRKGPVAGTQETTTYGPGLGVTEFVLGDAHLFLVATAAPLGPARTVARFAWFFGDDDASRKVGPLFAAEVQRQFEQDLPIWNAKRHEPRPALARNDGPIARYRTWARQFYPEEPEW